MYKKDASGKMVMFYNSPVFSDAYANQFKWRAFGTRHE